MNKLFKLAKAKHLIGTLTVIWLMIVPLLSVNPVMASETTKPVFQTYLPSAEAAFESALAAYMRQVNPKHPFEISETKVEGAWAYAVATADNNELEEDYSHSHEFIVMLARRDGDQGWLAIAPEIVSAKEYNDWLADFPDSLIDESTRAYFHRPESTQQLLNFSGHKLPWPSGQTAYVTRKNGLYHENQIDFDILGGGSSGDVYASKPGTVVFVKESSNSGCCDEACWQQANIVVVQHASNEYSWYVHLAHNSVPVSVGNTIGFGTKVGVEGNTGFSCGVHLHYMGSTGHTSWTDPNNANAAPWGTGITPVDFVEASWDSLTAGQQYTSQNSGSSCCGCLFAAQQPTNPQSSQSEYEVWLASQVDPDVKRSPHEPFLALSRLSYQMPSGAAAEIEEEIEEEEIEEEEQIEEEVEEVVVVEPTLPPSTPEIWCETHEVGVWSNEPVVQLNWMSEQDGGEVEGYAVLWDQMAETEAEAVVEVKGQNEISSPELSAGEWYVHIRAIGTDGQASETAHLGPFLIDATPPTAPTQLKSASHTLDAWSSEPTIDVAWAASKEDAAESGLAGYLYAWDQSPEGSPEGHDLLPPTASRVKEPALADGTWYFHLQALDQAGNSSQTVHLGPFLLDRTAPSLPSTSTSPPLGGTEGGAGRQEDFILTNNPQLAAFSWAPASDEGELKGYYVYWGEEESGTSDTLIRETSFTPEETIAAGSAATRYLRVAALDAAGNQSAWQTAATWHYDNVAPTGTLTIGSGGETVRSLHLTLNLAAEDTHSAVSQMRFSADGKEWTAWEAYNSRRQWQLENHADSQTVYAQVRDEAGNLSEAIQSSVIAELNVPAPSSDNYQIARRALTMGGGEKSSNNYIVRGNSGQAHETGHLQGNNYQVNSGFWAGANQPILTRDISLQEGWNHISLPLSPLNSYTAETVCDEIANQGGDIVEIDRWHNGGWDGYICGEPFNDFTLELGTSYFMRHNGTSTWTIEGMAINNAPPLTIQIGWNAIGIPHSDSYTAESLCDEIISQGVTALEIDRWHTGGWDGHICGLSFNDFAIERDQGYFVKTSSASTVTPSEVVGKRQATPLPPASPDDLPTGETLPVHDLQISNKNDTSVTLSWVTDEATTGYVQFGENPDRLAQVAVDSRSAVTSSKTHLVALDNLTPETTYHFEIVSGAEVVERGTFTTLSSLESIPDSDTIYGQLFWADGTTPAKGTLVHLTLQDADREGSEGEANVLSVLTDNNGYWHANLGNARDVTSAEPFTYSATGDEVVLTVQTSTNSTTTITLDTSQLRPAAPIILKDQAAWELYLPLIGN